MMLDNTAPDSLKLPQACVMTAMPAPGRCFSYPTLERDSGLLSVLLAGTSAGRTYMDNVGQTSFSKGVLLANLEIFFQRSVICASQ